MWNENTESAVFEYEPSFERSGLNLSPILMPLSPHRPYQFTSISKETFMGLPGLLADALPDAYGKALLDRWLATIGRTFANPVERLCYQGKRRPHNSYNGQENIWGVGRKRSIFAKKIAIINKGMKMKKRRDRKLVIGFSFLATFLALLFVRLCQRHDLSVFYTSKDSTECMASPKP